MVKNNLEGGNISSDAGPPTVIDFRLTNMLSETFEWFTQLSEAFAKPGNYRNLIRTKVDGKVVQWFADLNWELETSRFTSTLLNDLPKIASNFAFRYGYPV